MQPAVLQREHRFPPSTFPREKEKGTYKASSLWSSKRGSRGSVNSVGCVRVLFESREEIFEEEGERKNSLLIGTEVRKLREKEESEEYSKRERRRCKFSSFTMLARVKNYRNRSRKYILFPLQPVERLNAFRKRKFFLFPTNNFPPQLISLLTFTMNERIF